jgi:hypothetical protein
LSTGQEEKKLRYCAMQRFGLATYTQAACL